VGSFIAMRPMAGDLGSRPCRSGENGLRLCGKKNAPAMMPCVN
jgi:hypothetical protein